MWRTRKEAKRHVDKSIESIRWVGYKLEALKALKPVADHIREKGLNIYPIRQVVDIEGGLPLDTSFLLQFGYDYQLRVVEDPIDCRYWNGHPVFDKAASKTKFFGLHLHIEIAELYEILECWNDNKIHEFEDYLNNGISYLECERKKCETTYRKEEIDKLFDEVKDFIKEE